MKYLTFFSTPEERKLRLATAPPGVNKSAYIAHLLRETGCSVEILSPAWSKCDRWRYWGAFDRKLEDGITLHQLATFGTPLRWLTPLQGVYSLLQLFFYLLFHTQAGETVVVYHSYYLSLPIMVAKKIKKFKLILEVEEIYQDAARLPMAVAKWEKDIIHYADAYILSTGVLEKVVAPGEKPVIIISGTYAAETPRDVQVFDDGRVHCVYAGTLDMVKGGAFAAVNAAAFLSDKYHIHILGVGSKLEQERLESQIKKVQKSSCCKLSYDGVRHGEDLAKFLQRCQIGLSTQVPYGKYVATSFPSKILTYMANGLRVVSARIPAVEQSSVGNLIVYYDSQMPEEIAKAITSVNLDTPYDPRCSLKKLNNDACEKLRHILEELS